eukprot:Plantae.Rhodophyta-Purpureofilum_apyrenoidigerum.ctg27956.p1 GENE.Plantae.Rhodophyta-Purpureofilum_apyrenoidigerum.ctg27956~~Plantae.Rhodophyta-Purpureofilum_apyrenoidigerum.ctg27956.p1  ORF type:complete len:600 (+),score=72.48 Plantae.Rhodophyta-Purpureofilum_apyrenoidigerum.ctg27956:110-1909(+)
MMKVAVVASAIVSLVWISSCANVPQVQVDGDNIATRIVNGEPVMDYARFPYVVAILIVGTGSDFRVRCTGVLLDSNVVLSAAHCFSKPPLGGEKYQFCTGSTDLMKSKGHCANIKNVLTPDEYLGANFQRGYDLSLIQVDQSLDVGKARAISIYFKAIEPNVIAYSVGYGEYDVYGSMDYKMRLVDTKVITKNECEVAQMTNMNGRNLMCADGNYDGSQGSPCFGDSGGPLIVPGASSDDDVTIGVLSFGTTDENGNCRLDEGTAFSRFSSENHRRFLEAGCSKLGGIMRMSGSLPSKPKQQSIPQFTPPAAPPIPKPSKPEASKPKFTQAPSVPKPADSGRYIDFKTTSMKQVCKSITVSNFSRPDELQVTQEHVLNDDVPIAAWIKRIDAGGLVEICVKNIDFRSGFSGTVRVWINTLSSLREVCESASSATICGNTVRSASFKLEKGQRCTKYNSAYKSTLPDVQSVITTVYEVGPPAYAIADARANGSRVCIYRSQQDKSNYWTNVNFWLIKQTPTIKVNRVWVPTLTNVVSCKTVKSSGKSMLNMLIGVGRTHSDDGITTWTRVKNGARELCVFRLSRTTFRSAVGLYYVHVRL